MQENRSRLWELDQRKDDIRGWPVRDATGAPRGNIAKLIVDTDTQYITEAVLDDGTHIRAHDLVIGDRVVTLQPTAASAATGTPTPAAAPARAVPAPQQATAARKTAADDGDVVLQLADEELEVGKRRVSSGGVHVATHIVEQPVTKEVALHMEQVMVDRTPVDRPLSSAEAERYFRDQTVEVTAHSEVPVVEKRAHVVEEIVLKKTGAEHIEHVRDTVRHTDVNVTKLPTGGLQGGRR